MTSAAPVTHSLSPRNRRARWLFVLTLTLILHLIFFNWVSGTLRFPSPSSDASPKTTDIVSAALIAPTPKTETVVSEPEKPAVKPRIRKPSTTPPTSQLVPEQLEPTTEAPLANFSDASPSGETVENTVATTDTAQESSVSSETETLQEAGDFPKYTVKPPPAAILKFDIRKTPKDGTEMHGSGTIRWLPVEDRYQIQGEFGVLFITALRFSSTGTLEKNGIAPELYAEKRFRRSETNTHFHRERETVSFSASTLTYPRTGIEQDRASVIWQLAGIGRSNPELFSRGEPLNLMVAGVRDMQPWQIVIQGKDLLEVENQPHEAWHLVRTPRANSYDQKLEIWLAPALDWYPVRLRYTEPNGDVLDMIMTDLNVSP